MIIYNITSNVDESVHLEWLEWMQNEHISDSISTGKFLKARLLKVLVDEEMGGVTYAVMYYVSCRDTLDKYYEKHADRLRKQTEAKFGDKVLSFRSELQMISDHFAV